MYDSKQRDVFDPHKDYYQIMKWKSLKKLSINITEQAKMKGYLHETMEISSCSAKSADLSLKVNINKIVM